MKKNYLLCNLVIAAAMAVALTGCDKDIPPVGPTGEDGDFITATIEGYQQTRTFLEWGVDNQGLPVPLVKWSDGDQIALCADQDGSSTAPTYSRYTYVHGEDNPSSQGEYKFNLDANEKVAVGSNYAAFYPASMLKSMLSATSNSAMQADFTLPTVQHYTANSFNTSSLPMASWETSKTGMFFAHTCGLLELKVFGSDNVSIRSIEFEVSSNSPTKYPAGGMSLNVIPQENGSSLIQVTSTQTRATAGSPSVRLDCGQGVALAGADTATNFYIVLPPNLYTDFTLTLTAYNGQKMTKTFTASGSNSGLQIDRAAITTSSLTFHAEPAMQLGYRDDDQNFVEFDKDENGNYNYTTFLGDIKTLVAMVNGLEVNPTWETAFNEDEHDGAIEIRRSKNGIMGLYVFAYNPTAPYRIGEIRATYNNATTSAAIGSRFEGLLFQYDKDNILTAEELQNNSQANPWIVGLNLLGRYPAVCKFFAIMYITDGGYNVIPHKYVALEDIDTVNGNDITVTYYQPEGLHTCNYAMARSASNVAQQYYFSVGAGFFPVWIKVVDDTTISLSDTNYYGHPGITASSEEYFKPEFSNQAYQAITWTSSDSTAVEFWDGGSMLGLRNGKAREDGVIPDNADLVRFSRDVTVTATLANGNFATATVHNNVSHVWTCGDWTPWGEWDVFNYPYAEIKGTRALVMTEFWDHDYNGFGHGKIPNDYVSIESSNTDVINLSNPSNSNEDVRFNLNDRPGQSTMTYKVGSDICGYVKYSFVLNITDDTKSSNGNIENLTYGNQFNF